MKRRPNVPASVVVVFLSMVLTAPVWAQSPLAVYPKAVQLDHGVQAQGVVLTWTSADGVTQDVTAAANVTFEPEGIAEWREGAVHPVANGKATMRATVREKTLEIPVEVTNAGKEPRLSFRNDVEPVLMEAGCNMGKCHGSARGQNGFGLSLFGYDPQFDYRSLTRDQQGRRLKVADPEESLMLKKPLAEVPHEGGQRIEKGSKAYEVLRRWIAEGAQDDSKDLPQLTGIEILPKSVALEGKDATQRFLVQATYSDGSDRDVTDMAVLNSSDELTVKVGESGQASAGQRGEAYIMAQYGAFAEVAQVIAVPEEAELNWPDVPVKNYIDEHVQAKLKKVRVPPAELCSGETFVRRVYLDILGVLPTVEETRSFLEDDSPDKRAQLIDELLQRPEFSQLWAMKWAENLQIRETNRLGRKGMHRYNDWLRQSLAENKPFDKMVQELLTASGGNFTNPASNFYVLEREPTQISENVAQVFFGIRLQCAQCHNHPFERWTMDDYYSFASFFGQVGRKSARDPRETIIYNRGGGEVRNKRNNQPMAPKFLGGKTPQIKNQDRREVLAEWLASEKNPWFSRNLANRVWAHFFGRGIIEPVDDVRVSNPPSNPELLDALAKNLTGTGYDIRALVRDICNSYTYQQKSEPRNPELQDTRNFASVQIRRMPAEQLLDAVCSVTDTDVKFDALPKGARAVQVAGGDSGNYFLDIFGRPPRESACTCDRSEAPTLAQSLHMINGNTIQGAILAKDGRLAKLLDKDVPAGKAIRELYLAAYARQPSGDELDTMLTYVEESDSKQHGLEDVFWAVLNSKEFVSMH